MLVTQDLSFANMISDKIALLTNGKLTQFLPPNEFFKSQENILADNLINSYLQLISMKNIIEVNNLCYSVQVKNSIWFYLRKSNFR